MLEVREKVQHSGRRPARLKNLYNIHPSLQLLDNLFFALKVHKYISIQIYKYTSIQLYSIHPSLQLLNNLFFALKVYKSKKVKSIQIKNIVVHNYSIQI